MASLEGLLEAVGLKKREKTVSPPSTNPPITQSPFAASLQKEKSGPEVEIIPPPTLSEADKIRLAQERQQKAARTAAAPQVPIARVPGGDTVRTIEPKKGEIKRFPA